MQSNQRLIAGDRLAQGGVELEARGRIDLLVGAGAARAELDREDAERVGVDGGDE